MISTVGTRNAILFLLFISTTSICAATSQFPSRYAKADRIATSNDFRKKFITTPKFILTSYYRLNAPGKPITVYIEGDGVAWETKRRLSHDPTPRRPIVLTLATIDSYPNVVYIARPGQYSKTGYPICDPLYWSDKRFSNVVVGSMNQAIDSFLDIAQSNKIHLVGYSGGAAIAALIAAKREDVLSLRTIAGNLDPAAVNEYHGVSQMIDSLNPIDVAPLLKNIPQHHFVGEKDNIIPPFVAEKFLNTAGNPAGAKITVIKGMTHTDGWVKQWPELLMLTSSNDE